MKHSAKRGFTLIELLIIIAVIAILATVTVLVLNPAEKLAESRDARRVSDLRSVADAINIYATKTGGTPDLDGPNFTDACTDGANPKIFISVPSGNGEADPALPQGSIFTIGRVLADVLKKTDGDGWLPIDFGAPDPNNRVLNTLPIDSINLISENFFYRYTCGNGKYEIAGKLESIKFQNLATRDGGDDDELFEVGGDLTLSPILTSNNPPPPPPPPGETVRLVRDLWGVANVFANTDEGAFFGMGYATAEDRMYHMEFIRLLMKGRLSELIGNFGGSVQLDKTMRHLQYDDAAIIRLAGLDAETQSFLQAYADGVNQYLDDYAGNLLYLFGTHVPEPWSPVDSLLAWDYMTYPTPDSAEIDILHQFENLVAGGSTAIQAAQQLAPTIVLDDDAATVQWLDVPQNTKTAMNTFASQHPTFGGIQLNYVDPPHMSHGWAVSGSKTNDGKAKLVGDPRLFIRAPAYWHETHIVGETFNARGITVPGALGYFVGFNSDVAWTQTASAADYGDLFRLDTSGLPTNQYRYNGNIQTMNVSNETVFVKNGTPQSVTVRSSLLGPVVTDILPQGSPYVLGGEEYIFKAVPLVDQNIHTVQALIAMMRADSAGEYMNAINSWRTPIVNNIFATSQGDVGYVQLAAVPARSAQSPLAGMMAQNGGDPQYNWQGFIPYSVRPHVVNPGAGYVLSGNNAAIGSWYPIWQGTVGGNGDTIRSVRVRERLEQIAAGGSTPFTASNVFDIHYDDVVPANREIVRAAIFLKDVQNGTLLTQEAENALGLLRFWHQNGSHMDTDENYFALAHYMETLFRPSTAGNLIATYGGGESGLSAYTKYHLKQNLDAYENFGTSFTLSADDIAFIDNALKKGWDRAVAAHGSNPAGWKASVASKDPGLVTLPYFDTLFEKFGSLDSSKNVSYGPIPTPTISTIWSQTYQAYTQFIDFADIEGTQALFPMGTSEDPNGPFFNSQSDEWLSGSLRPAPLSEAGVDTIMSGTKDIIYVSP
jgi:prepilin-type N-terminal cleavage/methylation domain-containing protein